MDMEKWLANLGIGINEAEPMLMSFEDDTAEFSEESTRVEFSEEAPAEINDEDDNLTEETFSPVMFAAQTRGKLTCPLQSGTYYIRIECLENYGGYQLQMNSVEIKNLDSEPNNTYQKSIEAKSDETISGSIGFVNDKKEYDQYDWYFLTAHKLFVDFIYVFVVVS